MIMQYPIEQTINVSSIISKKHMLGIIRSVFLENLKLYYWINEEKEIRTSFSTLDLQTYKGGIKFARN